MTGEGAQRTRRIIGVYLLVSITLLAVLGYSLADAAANRYTVGPVTETLAPGDHIAIPMANNLDYYTVTFRLEMECQQELDVAVLHGAWDPEDDYYYLSKAINSAEASSTLASGEWNQRMEGLCDCGLCLVIDNTPNGQVNQTDGPVRVKYTLHWAEHRSSIFLPQFFALMAVAAAIPVISGLLYRKLEHDKAAEGAEEERPEGPSGDRP
jgi:hypothetical protein